MSTADPRALAALARLLKRARGDQGEVLAHTIVAHYHPHDLPDVLAAGHFELATLAVRSGCPLEQDFAVPRGRMTFTCIVDTSAGTTWHED